MVLFWLSFDSCSIPRRIISPLARLYAKSSWIKQQSFVQMESCHAEKSSVTDWTPPTTNPENRNLFNDLRGFIYLGLESVSPQCRATLRRERGCQKWRIIGIKPSQWFIQITFRPIQRGVVTPVWTNVFIMTGYQYFSACASCRVWIKMDLKSQGFDLHTYSKSTSRSEYVCFHKTFGSTLFSSLSFSSP